MVEKDEESFATMPSTVVVNATETSPSSTVGAAIDILEAKLASKGFQCPPLPSPSRFDKGKVDGKLLRLPTLIELAIIHGIYGRDGASEASIGFKSTYEKTLVPGNVVALHTDYYGFTRVQNGTADFSEAHNIHSLPLAWGSERFLVVDAGDGDIALYNPCDRRFLACNENGLLCAQGLPIVRSSDCPRANECFNITASVGSENKNQFHLYCPIVQKSAYCDGGSKFKVVQIYGFD